MSETEQSERSGLSAAHRESSVTSGAARVMKMAGQAGMVITASVACGTSGQPAPVAQPQAVTYACVEEDGDVVPLERCNDGYRDDYNSHGGVYYIHSSSGYHNYPIGSRVSGGNRVRSTDTTGRGLLGVTPKGAPSSTGTSGGAKGTGGSSSVSKGLSGGSVSGGIGSGGGSSSSSSSSSSGS